MLGPARFISTAVTIAAVALLFNTAPEVPVLRSFPPGQHRQATPEPAQPAVGRHARRIRRHGLRPLRLRHRAGGVHRARG